MDEPDANLVHTEAGSLAESSGSEGQDGSGERGARSSAVERRVHIADVAGSIPAVPTSPDPLAELLTNDRLRMNVEARFWPKVMKPGDWESCWTWTGSKGSKNDTYGKIKLRSYVTVRTHRLSYVLYYGHVPGDLCVCHRCDNPECVNPLHLFLGTNAENTADKVAKGRWKGGDQTGEKNGAAKLTASQVDQIKALISVGYTNTAIGKRFGITHSLVSRIRRGRSWGAEPMQPKYQSLKRSA